MSKYLLISIFIFSYSQTLLAQRLITRQGNVTFFSYTTVENIRATNNQALSIIDLKTGGIAVNMLMRAFTFEKALMQEHFNESYVESDLYPKASFTGMIVDIKNDIGDLKTKKVMGDLTIHGITKTIEFAAELGYEDGNIVLKSEFEILVDDFKIKIPPILAPNIAKTITVSCQFEYQPYEN